jgi:hypothetical protein
VYLNAWLARGIAAPTLLTAATVAFFPRQHPDSKPFTVAVIERGSGWVGLEPVARFTGTDWVNTWPEPDEHDAPVPDLPHVPTAWLGKPVPRQWVLWSTFGTRLRVGVNAVKRADGCSAPAALVLQNTKATVPDRLRGFEVATDTNRAVEGFRPVGSNEPEWTTLQSAITETFRNNEPSPSEMPLGSAAIRLIGLPVSIESLVRPVSASGPVVYYFEATKRLPMNRSLGVSIAGWIARSTSGKWQAHDVAARTLERNSGPVPERTPIALFRVQGRVYWLMRIAAYEGTDTSLFDVSVGGAREVLTATGSGC